MIPSNLLPENVRDSAFIAGGFAACPALADDIDVWVPVLSYDNSDPWDLCHKAQQQLATYLRDTFGGGFTAQDDELSKRVQNVEWARNRLLTTAEGYVMPIPIYRVGSVEVPGASLPYHVIVVGGDIDEVLSSFDISTHQVALCPQKGVIKGEHWTPITERGFVLKNKYSTPARMLKLAKRYGWPDPGEIGQ